MPKRKSTYTKSQLASDLAAKTGDLTKAKVSELLGHLQAIAAAQLKSNGVFTIPGMVKLTAKWKEATPAGTRPNPFGPGEMRVKAKPRRRVLRVRALKAMKEAV